MNTRRRNGSRTPAAGPRAAALGLATWMVAGAPLVALAQPRLPVTLADPPPSLGHAEPSAEGASPPGKSGSTDVAALIAKAVALHRAEKFDEARTFYLQAYALKPELQTLVELGVSEARGSYPVEAAQHLRQYLQQKASEAKKGQRPDPTDETVKRVEEHWLPLAEHNIAHLVLHVPTGAEIRVDGTAVTTRSATADPASPGLDVVSLDVGAGHREVVVRSGQVQLTRYVVLGGQQALELRVVPVPAPAGSSPAESSSPKDETPDATPPRDGAPRRSNAKWITVLAFAGAAVATGGVAAGFHVAYLANKSASGTLAGTLGPSGCYQTSSVACSQLEQQRTSERSNGNLADAFAAVAVVPALVALAGVLFWPSAAAPAADRPSPDGAPAATLEGRLVPLWDGRQTGLALTGSW